MQASVIDMQRDPSFRLATNQNEIFVENKTPGRAGQNLTVNTLDISFNYF